MTLRIKDWKGFQHYKKRNPLWIKLYGRLLNDPDWHALSSSDRGDLVMLWIIASLDKSGEGALPSLKDIAFHMRRPESYVSSLISRLSHWLYQDDTNVLSTCYQSDSNLLASEEKRREENIYTANDTTAPPPSGSDGDGFDKFWEAYPRKIGKTLAKEKYLKLIGQYPPQDLIDAAAEYRQDCVRLSKEEKFILHPSTFLNKDRWKDYCFAQLPIPMEGN